MAYETSDGKTIQSVILSESALESLVTDWYTRFPSSGFNFDSLILDVIDAGKVEVEE